MSCRDTGGATTSRIKDAQPSEPPASAPIKGYDAQEVTQARQDIGVVPHVTLDKSGRRSAAPDVIACGEGYVLSQRKLKLIEQGFTWAKTVEAFVR